MKEKKTEINEQTKSQLISCFSLLTFQRGKVSESDVTSEIPLLSLISTVALYLL